MNTALEFSEAAILGRVFRPDSADWSPTAAEAILKLEFTESDHEHMADLLDAAKSGELSGEAAATLEHYRHVSKMLELMKSRARLSLRARRAS